MTSTQPTFDPVRYKQTTRDQWQATAEAWHRWGPTLAAWLDPVTETMLDMMKVRAGDRVLDVAAGAGGQTLLVARRVAPSSGPEGHVVATDISSNILEFAMQAAHAAGLHNIETRVMDGENLDVGEGSFDAVISRVGLIYFPDQHKALTGMHRALKPGGRVGAIVYSTAESNTFFSTPVSIVRRRAALPPPAAGQPGPFSLAGRGVLSAALQKAGFKDVEARTIPAPLLMRSAAECLRFEQESFGALHQMLSGLNAEEKAAAWREIETELAKFETPAGFVGPCEMIVGVGVR
jgi:SAM-dependent methyltransferase